jgi:hypothetical protein
VGRSAHGLERDAPGGALGQPRVAAGEQAVQLLARVVEVFAGDPWAELIELVPESRAVVEGSILHAGRALRLMAAGDWQLAREDLVRASAAALPDHAREELHRLLARCDAAIAERAARRVPLEPVR